MSAAGGDYANAPVPEHLTVSGWRVALILTSFSIALPGFLYGAQAGLALGFRDAVLSALVGSILLCIGGCLTAIVSVRTRLTTYLLVQRSFGLRGAAVVNLVVALVHFCWFGVNISFLGDAMMAVEGEGYGIGGNFATFVIIGGMLITVSTIYGFRMLDRLALVAVPLLAAILLAVVVAAVRANGVVLEPAAAPPVTLSFGIAVTALIGNNMLTVAAMPDLSRYIRTSRAAVWAMILSFPIATPLLMIVAALTALATGETDIMKLIVGFGFGVTALGLLIVSIWTINALNLYSASLSLTATFPRFRQWTYTLVGGVLGTMIALMGIIDAFIPFLIFLGIIIPPIAAVYVIDGLRTFRGIDSAQSLANMPALRWEAIVTWLISIVVAALATYAGLTLTTVPALDATIVAAIVYLIILRLGRRDETPSAGAAPIIKETIDA